ncbi:MAG: DUF5606 domain-containing protein [Alloprevotella sp.]|nr:DUF5606 domain-containing protein [Alloprevotella sp.]
MKDTILAITGRPGLYRLVSRGRGNLIIESLDETKKRSAVGQRDRVTSLNDVTMYTDDEDVTLMQVFKNLYDALEGKIADINPKKASESELIGYMEKALPNYDRERVHFSDMRKLVQWYNILVSEGKIDFVETEEAEASEGE